MSGVATTSWCQAVRGDEVHIALVVQDREQLGNHEGVLEGPVLQAGQQSGPRVEAGCAQLRPGHRGGHQQLVTAWGKGGGGGSASREKPGLPAPDEPASHQATRWSPVPEPPSHLQCQRGAVDVPKVALGGLGPQDLLLRCPDGQGDPVSQIEVEVGALQTGEGQARYGHGVCGGQSRWELGVRIPAQRQRRSQSLHHTQALAVLLPMDSKSTGPKER